MNLWEKVQDFLDIKSGTIVGLWSLGVLAGSLLSIVETHKVETSVATCFCTVITALAATNVAKAVGGSTNGTTKQN